MHPYVALYIPLTLRELLLHCSNSVLPDFRRLIYCFAQASLE